MLLPRLQNFFIKRGEMGSPLEKGQIEWVAYPVNVTFAVNRTADLGRWNRRKTSICEEICLLYQKKYDNW